MNRIAVLRAAILSMCALVASAGAAFAAVGFQTTSIPVAGGTPIPVAIWYPTTETPGDHAVGLFRQSVAEDGAVAGRGLPLIVISHGNGGSKEGHYDSALALAEAGFVVAALEHTGDNYHDQTRATDVANRPRELHRLIDFMLADWRDHADLDPARVGAFGFSSGGFTVLATAGGEPDLSLVAPHCKAHPAFFACTLLAAHPHTISAADVIAHDRRIKALVVAAPALGFTFASGLSSVNQPVMLWRAENDHILPSPFYAEPVRDNLPSPPDYRVARGADHFDFLAPCTPALAKIAPFICQSATGFDRAAFHQTFNAAVVAFFKDKLKP
jgi:predicted dienelactone hydrolase